VGNNGNTAYQVTPSMCGRHFLGRLDRCTLAGIATTPDGLERLIATISRICRECDLSVVAQTSYFFAPDAVTGAICLSESHLTFHTWPEFGRVYLDVFVCTEERSGPKARSAFDRIATEIFASEEIRFEEVAR
jgi:S-adenosylmethionine decarboxylase